MLTHYICRGGWLTGPPTSCHGLASPGNHEYGRVIHLTRLCWPPTAVLMHPPLFTTAYLTLCSHLLHGLPLGQRVLINNFFWGDGPLAESSSESSCRVQPLESFTRLPETVHRGKVQVPYDLEKWICHCPCGTHLWEPNNIKIQRLRN